MKKIEIYDPPMCCSTGVCGTKVDEKLIEFASVLKTLSSSGVAVQRFNMAQTPQAFVENIMVKQLLDEKGQNALPFIFVDDELKWSGKIPPATEILKVFKIDQKPQLIKRNSCCGGEGRC